LFSRTKVHFFFQKLVFFLKISSGPRFETIFNISQTLDLQRFARKLQKEPKKKQKKRYVVSKKCLPLQRFNKQMIVLQI